MSARDEEAGRVVDLAARRRARDLDELEAIGTRNPAALARAMERATMGAKTKTTAVTLRLTAAELADLEDLTHALTERAESDPSARALAPGGWSRSAVLRLAALRGLAALQSELKGEGAP